MNCLICSTSECMISGCCKSSTATNKNLYCQKSINSNYNGTGSINFINFTF